MSKVQPLTRHFDMLFSKRKLNSLREDFMSPVKVRRNGQVTLPSSLRERAKLNVGDLLEAKLEKRKITLTPARLIDRHIAESMEQIKDGQFYGPFDTAEEMIESLHQVPNEFTRIRRAFAHAIQV